MKIAIISLLFNLCTYVCAQSSFSFEGNTLVLMESVQLKKHIRFDANIDQGDHEAIRLFKAYFNPSTLSAYRAFFLSQDWAGLSQDDFDKWQAYLDENPVSVTSYHYIKDQHGQMFLVFQIITETEQYTMPNSMIMKKIGHSWKHLSLQNDPQAAALKKFGMLSGDLIIQRSTIPGNQQLDALSSSDMRKPVEKFQRNELFERLKPLLAGKSLSAADQQMAEDIFLRKDDPGMIAFLESISGTKAFDWMEEINEAFGFTFFNILRTHGK